MCRYGCLPTEIRAHDEHELAFLSVSWERLEFTQVLHVAVVVVLFGVVVLRLCFRFVWLGLALVAADPGSWGSRVTFPKQAYAACLSEKIASDASNDCTANRYGCGGWWAAVLDVCHDKLRAV